MFVDSAPPKEPQPVLQEGAHSPGSSRALLVAARAVATTVSLCVCTPIGRGSALRAHSVAVQVGPDAPILLSCSVTHLVRRPDCPSGERDSISLRSASFSTRCSSARPELLPWKQEAVGSNPTALTILHLRLRKVVRSGAQPVSKAGPTSGSRVRLLHLPPAHSSSHSTLLHTGRLGTGEPKAL